MTLLLDDIHASQQAAQEATATEQDIKRVAEWQRREGISFARRESFARKMVRLLRLRRRAR